jgi:hypothetical protein
MLRHILRLSVWSLCLLGIAGCGLFRLEQRAPWRDAAERQCLSAGAVRLSDYVEPARGIDGPGACGMIQPFKVSALAEGSVGLKSRALLACPILPVLDSWIATIVQPAAEIYFRSRVVEINAGSYSCRNQNNAWGGSRSEHAFGNAVDVMSFRFANGYVVTVEGGWRGTRQEQDFLREVFIGSCRHFSTVLGPGSDPFHYNHFHLDLARHVDGRRICKPIIKFEPRIDPSVVLAPMTRRPVATSTDRALDSAAQDRQDEPATPQGAESQSPESHGAESHGPAPISSVPLPPVLPSERNRAPVVLGPPAATLVVPPPRPPQMGGLY